MSLDVQWSDTDPVTGEKRLVVAEKFAGRWRFRSRRKRREDWTHDVPPDRSMWEELLDALERRVQRREGVTEADVAAVRKILSDGSTA